MPTFEFYFETKRRKGTIRQTVKVFEMTEEMAKKKFYDYAKNKLKKFATILKITQL